MIACCEPSSDGTRTAATKIVAGWQANGIDVRTCWSPKGSDLNDALQALGPAAVKAAINAALVTGPALCAYTVDRVRPVMSLEEASAALDKAMTAGMRGVALDVDARVRHLIDKTEGPAPAGRQLLVRAGVSIGKTEVALWLALRLVDGDLSDQAGPPQALRRVAFVVADYGLALEYLRRTNELEPGIAQIYRGTEADDPGAPGFKMCLRIDDFRAVRCAGGSLASLCGSRQRGYCPNHRRSKSGQPKCGYRQQVDEGRPFVILVGPSSLVQRPPKIFDRSIMIGGEKIDIPPFDLVILDEPRPPDFTGGLGPKPFKVTADDLAKRLRNPTGLKPRQVKVTADPEKQVKPGASTLFSPSEIRIANEQLREIHVLLERLVKAGANYVTVDDIVSTGLGAVDIRSLRSTLLQLLKDLDSAAILQGDALRERLSEPGKWNRRHSGLARLCWCLLQVIGDNVGAAGDTRVGQIRVVEGDEPGFLLAWRETIHSSFKDVPTIILDATADLVLLRRWFPRLELAADIAMRRPPAVKVVQVSDRVNSYGSCASRNRGAARDRTVGNNQRKLQLMFEKLVRDHGSVGVILPKETEAALTKLWDGSPPVTMMHYGGLRGRDSMRDVRCLVTWSRPQARPIEFELLAAVWRGAYGKQLPQGEWFPQRPAAYLMTDGSAREAVQHYHPDPVAERFRRQSTECEIEQAVGRARGVRRTEASPLLEIVGTSVPLSIEIDELITATSLFEQATEVDAFIAAGITPVAGRGCGKLLEAALGGSADAWRKIIERNLGLKQRMEDAQARRENRTSAQSEAPPSTRWLLLLNEGDRYASEVWLDDVAAGDVDAALAVLAAHYVRPAKIRQAKVVGASQPVELVAPSPAAGLVVELSPIDRLLQAGIVPTGGSTFVLIAAILGRTAAAWRMVVSRDPALAGRLKAAQESCEIRTRAALKRTNAYREFSNGECPSETERRANLAPFVLRLVESDRQTCLVYLAGVEPHDVAGARAKLAEVGLHPADVVAVFEKRARSVKPSPLPCAVETVDHFELVDVVADAVERAPEAETPIVGLVELTPAPGGRLPPPLFCMAWDGLAMPQKLRAVIISATFVRDEPAPADKARVVIGLWRRSYRWAA